MDAEEADFKKRIEGKMLKYADEAQEALNSVRDCLTSGRLKDAEHHLLVLHQSTDGIVRCIPLIADDG